MKFSILRVLFIFTTTILLFSTCTKDNSPNNSNDEFVTAIINGVDYSGSSVTAGISHNGLTFEEALVIGSTSGGSQSLGISFYGPSNMVISEKTYENGLLNSVFGCDASSEICVLIQTTVPLYGSHTSENSIVTIMVTDVDYKEGGFIEGEFEVQDSIGSTFFKITDGKFRAKIDD